MKTPGQIAREAYGQEPGDGWAVGSSEIVPMIVRAIEADRAQREASIDQDWLDDAIDYGSCDQVEVIVTGVGGDRNGYRTVYHHTDFVLTGAQAAGMFKGIGEAS